ncbi:MAG: metallophosphoesterase [Euryarchaeota archaeon]|nr:metallophosphoesterase [Euryarchaeota archaeon]
MRLAVVAGVLLLVLLGSGTVGGPTRVFSFAVVSDIHIGEEFPDYGTPGYADTGGGQEYWITENARRAVARVNERRLPDDIRFVLVTGDLTDSAERSEFLKAREILDGLRVPYVPLLGNHDVWPYTRDTEAPDPVGDRVFEEVFAPAFDRLSRTFRRWEKEPGPVWDPEVGRTARFQNLAFDYQGFHVVGLDFVSRQHAPLGQPGAPGEADLHDFAGGTYRWLQGHLAAYPRTKKDNILLFQHHPMTKDPWGFAMAFSYGEYAKLVGMLNNYKYDIGLCAAGHFHRYADYNVRTLSLWPSTVCPGVEQPSNKQVITSLVPYSYYDPGMSVRLFQVYSDGRVDAQTIWEA